MLVLLNGRYINRVVIIQDEIESNCCASGSIYDPWSSQFVLKAMVLNLLVRKWFFLISGWFALRASRSTT